MGENGPALLAPVGHRNERFCHLEQFSVVLSYFDPNEATIAHPNMKSTCIKEMEFYEGHTVTHQKSELTDFSSVTSHLRKI